MSNEIKAYFTAGQTIYVKLTNSDGEFANVTDEVMETYSGANDTANEYRINLTETGSTGIYYAGMPDWIDTPGDYPYVIYAAGVSDPIGNGTVEGWDGLAASPGDQTADTSVALI